MRTARILAVAVGTMISACGPKVATVEVSPSSLSFTRKGETSKVAAVAKDSDGKAVEKGVTLAFASSNPSVATVDASSGAVTAVGTGDAILTASFQDKKGTAKVTVSIPASLSIAPGEVKLSALGAKASVAVKVLDARGREVASEVSFQNPIDRIVSLNKGELTALAPGEGEIQVSAGGVTSRVKVSVALPPAASVAVEKAALDLKRGASASIVASAKDPAKQTIQGARLTFASSNPRIAKVDTAGRVTAIARGKAKITVASGAAKAVVDVKVR